jgi:hypothetical protein
LGYIFEANLASCQREKTRFPKDQEGARKDVEQAFGVLQYIWVIVMYPTRKWSVDTMWEVMIASVIMHNMIVKFERDIRVYDQDWEGQSELVEPWGGPAMFQGFLHRHHGIRDQTTHNQLQIDLFHHM